MKFINYLATLVMAGLVLSSVAVQAHDDTDDDVHKIVLHMSDKNPKRMNLLLNNISNINKYYQNKGEEVMVEIVVYGHGLKMVSQDSPVKKRMKIVADNYENVTFKACQSTVDALAKQSGKKIELLPQVSFVQSGLAHLVELQESGWVYIHH